jgi:hypothetical protein
LETGLQTSSASVHWVSYMKGGLLLIAPPLVVAAAEAQGVRFD